MELKNGVNTAISFNDEAALRILLEDPSLGLGIVDETTVGFYMKELRRLRTESSEVSLEWAQMLTAVKGYTLLHTFGILL